MRPDNHRRDYLCQNCGKLQRLGSRYVRSLSAANVDPNLVSPAGLSCSDCQSPLTCLSYHQNIAIRRLTGSKRLAWYQSGAHLRRRGGKRMWQATFRASLCYYCRTY